MDENNVDVKVKRGSRIEVLRKISLRMGSFRNTRLIAACLVLLVIGSLIGTLGFLSYTSNSAANRFTQGRVYLRVFENDADVTDKADHSNSVTFGADKRVKLVVPNVEDAAASIARVSFYPTITQDAGTADERIANTPQAWAKPTGNTMVLGDVTLTLKDGWNTAWAYKDGTFYYRKVLNKNEQTPELLQKVTKTDAAQWPKNADGTTDAVAKLDVVAEATQAVPAEAANLWGCTVNSANGTVTVAGEET